MNRQSSDGDYSTYKMVHLQQQESENKNTFWSKSRNSILLVTVAIIEAIIVIALQSFIFVKLNYLGHITNNVAVGIPIYLLIFIISQLFQVALAWDAVRAQNTIQVIAFFLFNLCCFVYSVFQFKQMEDAVNDDYLKTLIRHLLIVNAVIIGVCAIIYLYLGIRLYQEFGWRIYKKIGADPEIRNMYRWYQILLSLLKLDVFFFLAYSLQYLVLVLEATDAEFGLTIAALPITCIFLTLIVYAVRHENKYMVYLVFIGLVAGCAYFSFKIGRMRDSSTSYYHKFDNVREFLTFFACVDLTLVLLTITNLAICLTNFGKGLKPHLLNEVSNYSKGGQTETRDLQLE
ncbi:unnamed protein product [Cunninghamella blakesleeana]